MTGATISAVETHFTRPRCLVVFAGKNPAQHIATIRSKKPGNGGGYLVDMPTLNVACSMSKLSQAFAYIERQLENGITIMRGTEVQRRIEVTA